MRKLRRNLHKVAQLAGGEARIPDQRCSDSRTHTVQTRLLFWGICSGGYRLLSEKESTWIQKRSTEDVKEQRPRKRTEPKCRPWKEFQWGLPDHPAHSLLTLSLVTRLSSFPSKHCCSRHFPFTFDLDPPHVLESLSFPPTYREHRACLAHNRQRSLSWINN